MTSGFYLAVLLLLVVSWIFVRARPRSNGGDPPGRADAESDRRSPG
jgi:hypothetical protein